VKKVTVLIPCYNEAAAVGDLIRNLPADKLKALGYKLDVLVVDNNSTDGTADVARKAGARVEHESKQGKGNAIRKGFYSLADDTTCVVMLDGDNTYRPDELLRMIEPIDSGFVQVVLGSRLYGQISAGSMPTMNRFGNRLFSWLVRRGYKVPVNDVLTGYYAWSTDALKALRPHLKSTDFRIEMEMVTKMARLGLKICSVPISYDARTGTSSLKPVKDGSRIFGEWWRNMHWQARKPRASRAKAAK
jgi:dolichol-phosphate hexosyltransferase